MRTFHQTPMKNDLSKHWPKPRIPQSRQKRDFSGEHATRLMDFETEIKIISSKALEPDADFKRLNTQLMVLMQTLRGLKFKGRPQQRKAKTEIRKNEQQKENFYQLLGVKPSASKVKSKKPTIRKSRNTILTNIKTPNSNGFVNRLPT